jgi:hypothetical protein
MRQLITEEQIQAAFDFLNQNSEDIGAARAMQIRTEYRAKAVLARLMLLSTERTDQARKAWATAHPEYAEACEAHANAEGEFEKLRDFRNKCTLLLECYRTIEASHRTLARIR